MIEFLSQPWHWSVGGVLIVAVMILLLLLGRSFGVSSTFRTMCAIGGAGRKISFFNFNWKGELWNLAFVFGALLGGYIAGTLLVNPDPMALNPKTVETLGSLGVSTDLTQLAPTNIFNWSSLGTLRGFIMIVVGGFLVGFGTRYAGGCTSGHAISGLSNLQAPSLLATIGFFIGGLVMTHLLLPFILQL